MVFCHRAKGFLVLGSGSHINKDDFKCSETTVFSEITPFFKFKTCEIDTQKGRINFRYLVIAIGKDDMDVVPDPLAPELVYLDRQILDHIASRIDAISHSCLPHRLDLLEFCG